MSVLSYVLYGIYSNMLLWRKDDSGQINIRVDSTTMKHSAALNQEVKRLNDEVNRLSIDVVAPSK